MKFLKLIRTRRSWSDGRSESATFTEESVDTYGDDAPVQKIIVRKNRHTMVDDVSTLHPSVMSGYTPIQPPHHHHHNNSTERLVLPPPPKNVFPSRRQSAAAAAPLRRARTNEEYATAEQVHRQRSKEYDQALLQRAKEYPDLQVLDNMNSRGKLISERRKVEPSTGIIVNNNSTADDSMTKLRARSRSRVSKGGSRSVSSRASSRVRAKIPPMVETRQDHEEDHDDFLDGEENICVNLDKADEMASNMVRSSRQLLKNMRQGSGNLIKGFTRRVKKELDPNQEDHTLGCSIQLVNNVVEILELENFGTEVTDAATSALDRMNSNSKTTIYHIPNTPKEITIRVAAKPGESLMGRSASHKSNIDDVIGDFQDTNSEASGSCEGPKLTPSTVDDEQTASTLTTNTKKDKKMKQNKIKVEQTPGEERVEVVD